LIQAIAIPDSAVVDCADLRTKTQKIFQIARLSAIFHINEILIYHDPFLSPNQANRERRIITNILRYIECPQYLRKRLFPLSRDTSAVGILSPLATPHHMRSKELKPNEIREAAIFLNQGRVLADVGSIHPLEVISSPKLSLKNRTVRKTTRINKTDDGFNAIIISAPPKGKYWGYVVRPSAATLGRVLLNRSEFKIATSRSCQPIKNNFLITQDNLLLAFGSPKKGLPEIVKVEKKKINELFDICINVMTDYGTRSLRLEESMMIALSKFDMLKNLG
jgi:predicted SPOUT superfamily RNA methylase MTH1